MNNTTSSRSVEIRHLPHILQLQRLVHGYSNRNILVRKIWSNEQRNKNHTFKNMLRFVEENLKLFVCQTWYVWCLMCRQGSGVVCQACIARDHMNVCLADRGRNSIYESEWCSNVDMADLQHAVKWLMEVKNEQMEPIFDGSMIILCIATPVARTFELTTGNACKNNSVQL